MTLRERIQDAIKDATKARDHARLDTLRMAKGAILIKEKERTKDTTITDNETIEVLRAEVKKRRQSLEVYQELEKSEEVAALNLEISVLEEFLPQQLSEEALEKHVRAYLATNPDMNHAGKLTGTMKKELGDAADGKLLSEVCRKVLG